MHRHEDSKQSISFFMLMCFCKTTAGFCSIMQNSLAVHCILTHTCWWTTAKCSQYAGTWVFYTQLPLRLYQGKHNAGNLGVLCPVNLCGYIRAYIMQVTWVFYAQSIFAVMSERTQCRLLAGVYKTLQWTAQEGCLPSQLVLKMRKI